MTTRDLTAALLGAALGSAAMAAYGLAVWPADHPGRTWTTLPRPGDDDEGRPAGDPMELLLIPHQKLPTRPAGE